MLFIPNGMLLNRCVCDGVERPFCEVVKENMSKLCSIGDHSVISDQADKDDVYEDEDYDTKLGREEIEQYEKDSASKLSISMALVYFTLARILYWDRGKIAAAKKSKQVFVHHKDQWLFASLHFGGMLLTDLSLNHGVQPM